MIAHIFVNVALPIRNCLCKSIFSNEFFGFISLYVESQNEDLLLQQLFTRLFKLPKCYSNFSQIKSYWTFFSRFVYYFWPYIKFFFLSFSLFFSLFSLFFLFSVLPFSSNPTGGSWPRGVATWVSAWRGNGWLSRPWASRSQPGLALSKRLFVVQICWRVLFVVQILIGVQIWKFWFFLLESFARWRRRIHQREERECKNMRERKKNKERIFK